MELLTDPEALQRCTGAIPRNAPGYTTNLYATAEQAAAWCASGRLRAVQADGAVLLLLGDRDFEHVYHIAADAPALTAALRALPRGTYSTDLIGQGDALEQAGAAYAAAGFAPHAFLRRMSRVQLPGPAGTGDAMPAGPEDAPAVAALLDRLLDPLAERLPELDELRQAAAEGRLLVGRDGQTMLGMLMFELKGQLAHLRFWHVAPEAQGRGVGGRLMHDFLARVAPARRIVLWVMGDNERSIQIYRRYGFEIDGLIDRIMTAYKDEDK